MIKIKDFINDTRGDGLIIEAAIIFPIIILFLAAVVLLSVYLPQRALLQEAAQIAATAVATDRSDAWISFDTHGNRVIPDRPANVYIAAFQGRNAMQNRWSGDVQTMIENHMRRGVGLTQHNDINVELEVRNYLIYKSVTVRATQTFNTPINFSLIGFAPGGVWEQTVEARAIVSNGDEFVRNIDIAMDLMDWVKNRFGENREFGDTVGAANNHRP